MRVLALLLLGLWASPVAAESLILSLSSNKVQIHSNFTGAELAVFGSIERDAATISRSSAYDVTVTVRGPRGAVIVREKRQWGPFWLNLAQRKYIAVPSFISVLANRELDGIAGDALRQKLRIGVNTLVPPRVDPGKLEDYEEPEFRKALIRLRERQNLFGEDAHGVTFLTPSLFKAIIAIPGKAPLGNYDVEAAVFAENVQLVKASTSFTVNKFGIEDVLAKAARERPFSYGLLTISLACLIGWLASVIFRRD